MGARLLRGWLRSKYSEWKQGMIARKFSRSERDILLAVKGVGPKVVERLELGAYVRRLQRSWVAHAGKTVLRRAPQLSEPSKRRGQPLGRIR